MSITLNDQHSQSPDGLEPQAHPSKVQSLPLQGRRGIRQKSAKTSPTARRRRFPLSGRTDRAKTARGSPQSGNAARSPRTDGTIVASASMVTRAPALRMLEVRQEGCRGGGRCEAEAARSAE
jgi:hypothetical protein